MDERNKKKVNMSIVIIIILMLCAGVIVFFASGIYKKKPTEKPVDSANKEEILKWEPRMRTVDPNQDLAEVVLGIAQEGKFGTISAGTSLFSDREYKMDKVPELVEGKRYLKAPLEDGLDVTVSKSGLVYMFVQAVYGPREELKRQGFVTIETYESGEISAEMEGAPTALMCKEAVEGETIHVAGPNWSVLVAKGEDKVYGDIKVGDFAKVKLSEKQEGTFETLELGDLMFNDRTYTFDKAIPKEFKGKSYLCAPLSDGLDVTVDKAGWVYVLTSSSFGQKQALKEQGFVVMAVYEPGELASSQNVVGQVLMGKEVVVGEPISYGEWGILFAEGKNKPNQAADGKLAKVKLSQEQEGSFETLSLNALMFNDRTYAFDKALPEGLKDKSYLCAPLEGGLDVTVENSGWVYVFTPSSFGQKDALKEQGFKIIATYKPGEISSTQSDMSHVIMAKEVKAGERISYKGPEWGVMFAEGENKPNQAADGKLAKVKLSEKQEGSFETLSLGSLMFNDRAYAFDKALPEGLKDKSYLCAPLEGGLDVTVENSGWVYVFTPSSFGQKDALKEQGFKLIATYKPGEISSTQSDMSHVIMAKEVKEGDRISYKGPEWGVLFAEGENKPNQAADGKLAKIVLGDEQNGKFLTLSLDGLMFSDRAYKFDVALPAGLEGKTYLCASLEGGLDVTVENAGWVYVLTPSSFGQKDVLAEQGFTIIATYKPGELSSGQTEMSQVLMAKEMKAGESIFYEGPEWGIVFAEGENQEETVTIGELAKVKLEGSQTGIFEILSLGELLFSDRTYTFDVAVPEGLDGKSYLLAPLGGISVTVEEAGWVYVWTNDPFGQRATLEGLGFTVVTTNLPGALSSSQNVVGQVLMGKEVAAGETITYGEWGILFAEGENPEETTTIGELAKVKLGASQTGTFETVSLGAHLFSDRTYTFDVAVPAILDGKSYLLAPLGGITVTVEEAGWVYVWTNEPFGQKATLEGLGFAVVTTNLPGALSSSQNVVGQVLMGKEVAAGETITYGEWGILFAEEKPEIKLAKVKLGASQTGTFKTLSKGSLLFIDRDYTFDVAVPEGLDGKSYLLAPLGGITVTVEEAGWVYVWTNEPFGQKATLEGLGFAVVTTNLPGALSSSQNVVGQVLMGKEVAAGETITYGEWGILFAEEKPETKLAKVKLGASQTGTFKTLSKGSLLFSDRDYTFDVAVPEGLDGKNYLLAPLGDITVTVEEAGWVYVWTNEPFGQKATLEGLGFTVATTNLPGALSSSQNVVGQVLMGKEVAAGETITYGEWGILFAEVQ